jgi:hypothetical protein
MVRRPEPTRYVVPARGTRNCVRSGPPLHFRRSQDNGRRVMVSAASHTLDR